MSDYFLHEINTGKIDTLKLYLMIKLLEEEKDWGTTQIQTHKEDMLKLFESDYQDFFKMSADESIQC